MAGRAPVLSGLEAVYAGEVVVLKQLQSVRALLKASRTLVEDTLGDQDPPTACTRLERGAFLDGCASACGTFLADQQYRKLWQGVVTEVLGSDAAAETTWDGFKIRAQPPAGLASAWDGKCLLGMKNPTKSMLPMHRDTWGSNIQSQVNWWTPLYPLDPRRTLELFPSHFEVAVQNSSSHWKVSEFSKWRKSMLNQGAAEDPTLFAKSKQYASLPEASHEAVEAIVADPNATVPVLIEPGDLILFSAAHLHKSAENTTDLCRFSTETRTVSRPDFAAGAGAPDVDGNGGAPRSAWFKGVMDDGPLA